MYRSILNSKKIKYQVLKNILEPKLVGIKEVNMFISLNSILKSFYGLKPDVVAESLDKAKENALSSEIINIIAHYRHFFWSRYGICSNYYIYYSLEMNEYCTEINIDYKSDYYEKRMGNSPIKEYLTINKHIESNLELIEILTEYLPNIYFINTKTFEPSALPQLIIERNKQVNGEKVHNFILTNDLIDYQLVNNPYTDVINLNADNSKIISQNNLIQQLLKSKKTNNIETELSNNFFIPILSLTGLKKLNIKGIKGYGNITTVRKLDKLLKENKIQDIEYKSMDDILTNLGIENESINDNFKILSLKNISKNISNKEFINIKKQMNNKSDNISLMDINNKYYETNPLMLIELMEGEY